MRVWFVVLLMHSPFLVLCSAARAQQSDVWEKYKTSVVQIEAAGLGADNQPRRDKGTGFFINSDGYILTALHIVGTPGDWKSADPTGQDPMAIRREIIVTARDKHNRPLPDLKAVALYYDLQLDLALLRVFGEEFPAVQLGNSSEISSGSTVHAIGFGDGIEPAFHNGTVTIPFDSKFSGLIRLDMPLVKGDSGGPVFDKRGAVVGVINAGKPEMRRVAFAVPINLAANFVNMTLRAAAVEDALRKVREFQEDERLPLFPSVANRFKQVDEVIKELQEVAELLKENPTVDVQLFLEKNPATGKDELVAQLQVVKEFAKQYLPERIEVVLYFAWQMVMKGGDEKKKGVPETMTPAESRIAGFKLDYDADSDKIKSALTGVLRWPIGERLKWSLKQKYGLSEATLDSLDVRTAEVEVRWWVKGKEKTRPPYIIRR